MRKISTLILDDEESITSKLERYLSHKDYEIYTANTPSRALQILTEHDIDIMLCDVLLPEANGIEVLKKVRALYPEIEVIMISGHGDMDTVINAVRLGASDFIRKPFSGLEVQLAIERTRKYITLQEMYQSVENHNSLISRELENLIERDFIGQSEAIQHVLELTLKAARDKDVSVLITGENGTGKEIIARIIHFASERKNKPFCPVNASAIPETLLESEFFGHRKGSFTGAISDKKGCMELADGGSLFLDEIADMPLLLQAKLLRVIEEKMIRQVGGSRDIPVDLRIISATNHDIGRLIESGKFRLDLFHRINTYMINIPPLRERKEDIAPLLLYFLEKFSRQKGKALPKYSDNLLKQLKKYDFPGNVRELKNMVERALILANGGILKEEYFFLPPSEQSTRQNAPVKDYDLAQNEINLIRDALARTGNSKVKAAQLLGIPRYTLIRKIKKYNLN